MKPELLLLPALALLAACGAEVPPATPPEPVMLTADQAQIYAASCAVCHSYPGSGAPIAGVLEDWEEELARGLDGMLRITLEGSRGMPPLGGCAYCSEDDFVQLIQFMTGGHAR